MAQVTNLLEQQPPHAVEAEIAVLGAMILNGDVIGDVLEILRPDDFYRDRHAAIFKIIVRVWEQNLPIDLVHVNQAARDMSILEEIGGTECLVEIAESVPSAAGAAHYAEIVLNAARKRGLITALESSLRSCYRASDSADTLIDSAEAAVFALRSQKADKAETSLGESLQAAYEQQEAIANGLQVGVPTGLADLDKLTGGLHPGELIIVAGRPSIGKTALALNFAEHIAVDCNKPVGFFSMEMATRELGNRIMFSRAGIGYDRGGSNYTPEQWSQLASMVGETADSPMTIATRQA